jgi:hypothetical protein
MSTNYVAEKMTAAIKNHLVTVDAIPPIAEPARLASELTEVVWTELSSAGLSREALENLFAPAALKTKAQGRA